jgi:hypothetical protein
MKNNMILLWTQKFETLSEYIKYLFVLILTIFEDIHLILTGVLILIVFDQFSGVWKAIKLRKFKWSIFSKVYVKLIFYFMCIIATFSLEKLILGSEAHYFTKGIASVIGVQELASIYLNTAKIIGKDFIKEYIKHFSKKALQ